MDNAPPKPTPSIEGPGPDLGHGPTVPSRPAAAETDASAERFSRLELLLGREGVRKLRGASVVVAGLGAVGSYAVEGLARAGIDPAADRIGR